MCSIPLHSLQDPSLSLISYDDLDIVSSHTPTLLDEPLTTTSKQVRTVGAGGYGTVKLAKWRGAAVAVKSVFALGAASGSSVGTQSCPLYVQASSLYSPTPLYTALVGRASLSDVGDFLAESRILAQLRHPNIVLMLGVCVVRAGVLPKSHYSLTPFAHTTPPGCWPSISHHRVHAWRLCL